MDVVTLVYIFYTCIMLNIFDHTYCYLMSHTNIVFRYNELKVIAKIEIYLHVLVEKHNNFKILIFTVLMILPDKCPKESRMECRL